MSSVEYIHGDNNVVADCLSRPTCSISVDAFDLSGIARAQKEDTEIYTRIDSSVTHYLLVLLYGATSLLTPRDHSPATLRDNVIRSLHSLSHPGVKYAAKLVQ